MRPLLLFLALSLTACAPRVPDTAQGIVHFLGVDTEGAGPLNCSSEHSCGGYTRLTPDFIGEKLGHKLTPSGADWVLDTGTLHVELWGEGPTRPITISTQP